MEKHVKDRLSILLKTIHMNEQELAAKIKKSNTTVYRIMNGETTPTRSTVQSIADATCSDYNWLMFGTGEMLPADKSISNATAIAPTWKDEAYQNLKKERDYFKERYTKVIDAVLSGNLGKLLALKNAGALRKAA